MTISQIPSAEWPEPIPLPTQVVPPPFPTHALPAWLADYIEAEATAAQVPQDLAGMLCLAALSTAIQGRINAIANNENWVEPITLYTATIMPSGHRKSSIFDRVNRPLLDWETFIQDLEWPVVSQSQQEYKELEQAIEKADTAVQKMRQQWNTARMADPTNPHVADAELADLEAARQIAADARTAYQKAKPRYPTRLVYNDITPEKASTALSQQRGEHISIISDEGGVFEVLTGGRYGDRLNLDVFLKGHSGNIILVDRVGRDSERINRPMISLGLAIQPQVVQEIGKSRQMHGRGLLARFLYAAPDNSLGDRMVDAPQASPEIRARYENTIKQIASAAHALDDIHEVRLSDDASGVFLALQQQIEPMLREDVGDLDDIVEWASKSAGAILRISVLIAVARVEGMPREVTYEDMIAAIEFFDYLVAHARRAHAIMGIVQETRWEAKILKRLVVDNVTEFTSRDIYRTLSAHRHFSADEFEVVLENLVRTNYLRKIIDSTKPYRYHWVVNPALHAEE